MKYEKGVVYAAGGDLKYIQEAIYSAKSLKRFNPGIQTAIFSNRKDFNKKHFDHFIYEDFTDHPQKLKMVSMLNSPFKKTLFLDSDTEVKGNIMELFDFLDIYDMGLTHRVKCHWSKSPKFIDYIDHDTFQGGFLLFKNTESSLSLIQKWYDLFGVIPKEKVQPGTPFGDQIILNQLFFEDELHVKLGLKYVLLPNKVYNARPWMWQQLIEDGDWKNVKILHNHKLNIPRYKYYLLKLKARFLKNESSLNRYR